MAEPAGFDHAALAAALREAMRVSLAEGPVFDPAPTLDLAVVAFVPGRAPVWANVLIARGHPEGVMARIGPQAGAVEDIRYLVDPTDAQRRSIAWAPGADWTRLEGLQTLHGTGPYRSIAPYPASLIKLMVAVGVGLLVDQGRADWNEAWRWGDARTAARTRSVLEWTDGMITESRNEDTSALVALLHARGLIRREGDGGGSGGHELHNGLHEAFERNGLPTLRLAQTRPDGGWLNRDGAGVGRLQMTAWDTVRLMWRMLPLPAPWLPPDAPPLLQPATARVIWERMADQALHEVLSSRLGVGLPGWRAGLPAQVPARWLDAEGRARAADRQWPGDLRPLQAQARVRFAHKTGTTENYLSDAGLVESLQPGGRRYLIALLSTLGSRHAPHPLLAGPGCIAALGARVDAWLEQRLG